MLVPHTRCISTNTLDDKSACVHNYKSCLYNSLAFQCLRGLAVKRDAHICSMLQSWIKQHKHFCCVSCPRLPKLAAKGSLMLPPRPGCSNYSLENMCTRTQHVSYAHVQERHAHAKHIVSLLVHVFSRLWLLHPSLGGIMREPSAAQLLLWAKS